MAIDVRSLGVMRLERLFRSISFRQVPIAQPVNEGENFRNDLVNLRGNLFVKIEAGEDLQQVLVLTDRNIVLPGQFDKFFGQGTLPFRNELGRTVLFRLVAQRGGLPARIGFLVHTFTFSS